MAELTQHKKYFKENLEVNFRSATISDAYGVMKIGKHLMEDGEGQVIEGDEFTFNEEHEKRWIQEHLDNFGDILIIAEIIEDTSNQIIGFLNFAAKKRRRISHTGELGMGLHKNYRNLGIGRVLLEQFIKWAKNNPQIEKVNLRVLENNTKAIKIYKSFGFNEDGRKKKEIKLSTDKYLDDISMELIF